MHRRISGIRYVETAKTERVFLADAVTDGEGKGYLPNSFYPTITQTAYARSSSTPTISKHL